MAMDFNFKESPRKKRQLKYLLFLPKALRKNALQALLVNLLIIILSLVFYPALQQEIPLFISLPSEQRLITKEAIFILPALASSITLIHFLIIKDLKNAHQTVLRVFMIITEILEIIILAILLRLIIILN